MIRKLSSVCFGAFWIYGILLEYRIEKKTRKSAIMDQMDLLARDNRQQKINEFARLLFFVIVKIKTICKIEHKFKFYSKNLLYMKTQILAFLTQIETKISNIRKSRCKSYICTTRETAGQLSSQSKTFQPSAMLLCKGAAKGGAEGFRTPKHLASRQICSASTQLVIVVLLKNSKKVFFVDKLGSRDVCLSANWGCAPHQQFPLASPLILCLAGALCWQP